MTKQELIEADDAEADEITSTELSLTEPMAVGLARAEIDAQIATARRFPRSVTRASENILSLVTMDEETAGECMYALPRGGKPIKGPSIRLAEIIFQCWGNARADARVIHVDRVEKVVVAEGVYHDLETNSACRATVRRRIVDKRGRLFQDDMIIVTGNAACSIAKRNAILAGVPKAVWNKAYRAAEGVVAGNITTLTESRGKAIKAFGNFGVTPEQIFPALGVDGLDDIGLDHIPVLRGMFAALKNGEATVEEMFAGKKGASNHERIANPLSDTPHDPETGEINETTNAQTADHASGGERQGGAVAGDGQTSAASPEPATDDDFPGDKPLPSQVAREKGMKARAEGLSKRSMPSEYREPGRENEAAAWVAGFDGV